MVYEGALFNDMDGVLLAFLMGGDLNVVDSELCTPCHLACELGHAECVELLLALGAMQLRNIHGRTPYQVAVQQQEWACVEKFVK